MDDGIEHYDASIPYTTSCPYLPGQPLNLLYVPIEILPLRFRSASMSSMANGDIKTMNPADKFMTPRPPPPTPGLPRLNTSTSVLTKKRSARSLSPKSEKLPWSPRSFFGLRSQSPARIQTDRRGRSSSASKVSQESGGRSSPTPAKQFHTPRSVPNTRAASPQSFKTARSRDPSPLRQSIISENSSYNAATLIIPDEIAEEAEDDDNFASHLNRLSLADKQVLTPLAPPPSGRRSPQRIEPMLTTTKDTSKPLPKLPEESPSLMVAPLPLRLRTASEVSTAHLAVEQLEPRSHFSTSTISTAITSPTDSTFSSTSLPGDEDIDADGDLTADVSSNDEFTYSPTAEIPSYPGFAGYSLPEEGESELTIVVKQSVNSRATFGPGVVPQSPVTVEGESEMTALEQLLSEMGYLGGMIAGK
jgi:hypothetical protein